MYKIFFKRLIDVVVSLGIIIVFFPIFLLVGLIIKLQDGGNIIFIQQRLGKQQKKFEIYKFRSMPINTPNVASTEISVLTITAFGKLIRRTNIDELPQLLNILKGDMSLVGPRPSLLNQDQLIKLRSEHGVYSCTPGLTGLAQVNSYDNMSIEEKVNWDSKYVNNITFTNDLVVVLKTVLYLFRKPPTY